MTPAPEELAALAAALAAIAMPAEPPSEPMPAWRRAMREESVEPAP